MKMECSSEENSSEENGSEEKTKKKSSKKSATCPICGRVFTTKYYLREHAAIHYDTAIYSCEYCAKGYKIRNSLMAHLKICQVKLSGKPKVINIDLTTEEDEDDYKKNGDLTMTDVRTEENIEYTFNADLTNKYEQTDGKTVSTDIKKSSSPEKKFYKKKEKNIEHISKLTEEMKPLDANSCDVCGRTFNSKSYLRKHKAIHFDTAILSCEYCRKGYKIKESLMAHLKVCKEKLAGKPKLIIKDLRKQEHVEYSCNEDVKIKTEIVFPGVKRTIPVINSNEKMDIQYDCKIKNTEEPKPRCIIIKKTEEWKAVKENECDICGHTFSTKTYLRSHRAIHSDAVILSCEYCGKGYKIRESLMAHLKVCKEKLAGKPKLINTGTDTGTEDGIEQTFNVNLNADLKKEEDIEHTYNGYMTDKSDDMNTEISTEGVPPVYVYLGTVFESGETKHVWEHSSGKNKLVHNSNCESTLVGNL